MTTPQTTLFPKRGSYQKHRFSPLTVMALGCLAVILVGTVVLMLPVSSRNGQTTGFVDSLMTSTSAACVTGLVPFNTYQHWSTFGQVVLLILIQIGGIGFMTMVALLTKMLGRSFSLGERRLIALTAGNDKAGSAAELLKSVTVFTFGFEAIGTVLLATRMIPRFGIGRGIWFSAFHSISGFCNAGFDLMGFSGESSLCGFSDDIIVNITIMLLILAGGIGFVVWQEIFTTKCRPSKFSLHTKIVLSMTGILLLGGAVLFYLFERNNLGADMSVRESVLTAFFSSVTPRTAGFNTVDLSAMTEGSTALTILLMVIGGAPGSTAGGIKITTFAVLLCGTLASARQVESTSLFKRRISGDLVRQASAIGTIYFGISSVAIVTISAIESFSFTSVCYEVTSALSNVGMTLGISGSLGAPSKLIISILMYFGRIGLMSFVTSLAAGYQRVPIERPCENVLL